MQVSDLTIEVRDSSLARVGQILAADLVGFETALRFNKVGSWKITLRSDHPLADTLRAPGSGIIVTGPNGVLLSGPTASATNIKTAEDPTGTWEIVGTDDGVILGERLAYPVPSSSSLASQTTAYDTRTGKAETVAKAFVNANIGPSAPADRKISALTIDTDLARGSTVVANARFDKLGELISSLLVIDGLGFDIRQSGSTLVFEIFQPVDRSSDIRMDVDNLRLEKSEYGYQRPDVTRVIVAGQGQGGERTFLERSSTASVTAESAWGRRIEVFKDQRNTNDTTELQNAGDELLATGGKTVEGIKVTPSDDQTMRFGRDWGLGDKVTVVVGSTQIAQIVTEVAIVITENGVKIGATLGVPGVLEDYEATLLSASTDQSARITALEVNESSGGINAGSITTGTLSASRLPSSGVNAGSLTVGTLDIARVADSSITTAKLADASVTNVKLANSSVTVNGTSVALGGSATITQTYNYVTNGAFDIWQRGTSSAVSSIGYNSADRWRTTHGVAPSSRTISRQALVGAIADLDVPYYFRSLVTTIGSGTSPGIGTRIEDVNSLQGKTATLSYWAKANSAWNAAVTVAQNFGTGGSASVSVLSTTQTYSTSWTRYSFTFTVPATSGKTIGADSYLEVALFQSATSGSTFEIAGVQLEAGSVATAFRRQNASISAELAACQRYYYRNTPGIIDGRIAVGVQQTTTSGEALFYLPTEMRAAPTPGFSNLRWTDGVAFNSAISALSVAFGGSTKTVSLSATFATNGAARYPGFISAATAAGYVELSAEL